MHVRLDRAVVGWGSRSVSGSGDGFRGVEAIAGWLRTVSEAQQVAGRVALASLRRL